MRRRAMAVVVAAVVGTACGGQASPGAGGGGSSPPGDETRAVTVFAAASLTRAFRDAARAFRETEGGRPVILNLAGSQTLAAQILAGAPAHVFASADSVQMERVREEGLLRDAPVPFAENGLAIVTEVGNPREVRGLHDLARDELAVVLGAPEVPVGRYAREALDAAGVAVHPVSLETDVKQVLAKVALGEADAGIVYRTDLVAAGETVDGMELSPDVGPRARYRVGIVSGASPDGPGLRFVQFLRSPEGRRILRSHGFRAPGDEAVAAGSTGAPSAREP